MISSSPARNAIMLQRNNLVKFFSSSSRPTSAGGLLTPVGGAATHAYFQYQHLQFHRHNQQSSSCVRSPSLSSCFRQLHGSPILGNGSSRTDSEPSNNQTSSSQNSEIKSKLEALKEKLSENLYFEKYKEKFQHMELTSPRELLVKLEQLDARISGGAKEQQNKQTGSQVFTQSSRSKDHFLLKDVMELSRIKDLEREDITFLWQEFHKKKEGLLAAVMSGAVFDKMVDLAGSYPMFLLPLPREHGYEFLFVQYMNNAFHFTPLIAYQTHKENAPECLRLINYTDLQNSKDLVLMRGEFDRNLMTTKDAHIMAVQVNFYYGETSNSRRRLLELFFSKPDSFQHMDLIEEFKKLEQTHPHLFEFEQD